jgi:hypothetical protein
VSAPACRTAVAAGLLFLAACASPPPKDHPPETGRPAPAQNDAVADASFDWHSLVAAPFGTLLKESPIRLHEVLLFHDESHGPAEIESRDCYAVDGAAPTFVGNPADEYLMCFEHDRLERIEASVQIAFSARLAVVPGERTAELLITLSNAATPNAEQVPPRDPAAPPSAVP